MSNPYVYLDALPVGRIGRVAGMAALPGQVADRLLELGFEDGAEVEMLHRAPMGGDPVAVRVDGATVALRKALARAILLAPETVPPTPCAAR